MEMTEGKKRYPLDLAELVGQSVVKWLAGACEKIEIAGSIRRRETTIGDIEILAIPKVGGRDMFGEPVAGDSSLDRRCNELLAQDLFEYRLNVLGDRMYGPDNKYVRHVGTGIPVDIFTASAEFWGMALMVRTGPKEFSQAIMSRFQELNLQGHAYAGVSRGQRMLDCPTEQDVFDFLKWDFIGPEFRGSTPGQRWGGVRQAILKRAGG